MKKINLLFFGLAKDESLVSEIAKSYESNEGFDVNFYDDERGINKYFTTSPNGIFFFSVRNKDELQSAVIVLRSQKKLISEGRIKPTCILPRPNIKVEKILAKYGCKEILEGSIKPKSASFKIDFWARQISSVLKKDQSAADYNQELKGEKKNERPGSLRKNTLESLPSLELASDIWIVKSKTDTKKVLSRWLVRAVGPSPKACKWLEQEGDGRKQKCWKLEFSDENQEFILDDGAWYFYGAKPEFDWKVKKWSFSSDAPHLFFKKENNDLLSRFELKEKKLFITENSQYALNKEELIEETFDTNYSFKSDEAEQEEKSNLENDEIEKQNLEGKINESDKSSSHMRGKNLSEDDTKGYQSALNGKEVATTGHLKGDVSQKNETKKEELKKNKDKIELEKSESEKKYKEESLGGHIEGSVKSPNTNKERERSGFKEHSQNDLMGKTKADQSLGDKPSQKNKSSNEESDLETDKQSSKESSKENVDPSSSSAKKKEVAEKESSGTIERAAYNPKLENSKNDFDRKGKTDSIDREPHGSRTQQENVNKEEKKEKEAKKEREAKERNGFKENSKNGFTGKGKTDSIDRSPYGSRAQQENTDKEEKERNGFKENSKNDFDGKGKTDSIDRSPYGSRTQQQKDKEKREKERNGFKENSQNGLDGKGSTDSLDRSPYGSKAKSSKSDAKDPRKSNFQENEMSGMSGKGSTDEIDRSHYDSRQAIDHKKQKEEREANVQELGGRSRKNESTPSYEKGSVRFAEADAEIEYGSQQNAEDAMNDALAPDLNIGDYEAKGKREHLEEDSNIQALFEAPPEMNIESGDVRVILKQTTKAGNTITFMCQFEDFYPEELIVQAPKNSLEIGSEVKAKVTLTYSENKVDVIIKGNILEKEKFDDKVDTLVIEIESMNNLNYESFIKLYHNRQENINSFLLKAKGY